MNEPVRTGMAALAALAALSGITTPQARALQEPPHLLRHYVFYGLDRDRILDPAFLGTPAIAGAQLKYTWRELEPEPDRYDFGAMRHDLASLTAAGKKLFVQLQDVSFVEERTNVPNYLTDDPRYGGGVASQYAFENDDEAHPVFEAWVARRWDPAVRERLSRLFAALGAEFDGRIAGINTAETSVAFGRSGRFHPSGYTYQIYFESIRDLMTAARRAFRQSDVIIYANFMPGEELPDDDHGYLRGVYEHAAKIGVGVGGPDLLPYRWFQRQHSLPLIAARPPGIVAGLAVQDGNLAATVPATGRSVTVADLVRIATEEMRLDYLFWGTEEPYWSEDVLPFLRSLIRS